MARPILVTGATGKQGGGVISALLSDPSFTLLAVTRTPSSPAAQRLASLGVTLVQGDLDDVPRLFDAARAASPTGTLWGVFSVQAASMRTDTSNIKANAEYIQGAALVDEAIKAGVTHFVYSSVERGGEERSWENPTDVPHFMTKHEVERYLRERAEGTGMGWTILRPVIFYENLVPGFSGKVFLTALRDTMGTKRMPWISTTDIGYFGAMAFRNPQRFNGRALSLGGNAVNFAELSATFEKVTGAPAPTTWGFLGSAIKWMPEVGRMLDWFRDEGYKTDEGEMRKLHPEMMGLETWLRTQSKFPKVD